MQCVSIDSNGYLRISFRELWRADAKLDTILQNCRDEVRKAERILSSAVDKVSQYTMCGTLIGNLYVKHRTL